VCVLIDIFKSTRETGILIGDLDNFLKSDR
jgi:hypothetical protein